MERKTNLLYIQREHDNRIFKRGTLGNSSLWVTQTPNKILTYAGVISENLARSRTIFGLTVKQKLFIMIRAAGLRFTEHP